VFDVFPTCFTCPIVWMLVLLNSVPSLGRDIQIQSLQPFCLELSQSCKLQARRDPNLICFSLTMQALSVLLISLMAWLQYLYQVLIGWLNNCVVIVCNAMLQPCKNLTQDKSKSLRFQVPGNQRTCSTFLTHQERTRGPDTIRKSPVEKLE
jgi:hypothetical protein